MGLRGKPEWIEVKFSFTPADTDAAIEALEPFGLERAPTDERTLHFFDTSKLAFFDHGIIVRTRQALDDGAADATLKIRGPAAPDVARRFVGAHGDRVAKFEGDQNAGRPELPSFSLTYSHDAGAIGAVLDGRRSLGSLFDAEAEWLVPQLSKQTDSVRAFGPIHAGVRKVKLPGFSGKATVEVWRTGSIHLLEVSKKKPRSEAREFGDMLIELAAEWGLEQLDESKTRIALLNAPSGRLPRAR